MQTTSFIQIWTHWIWQPDYPSIQEVLDKSRKPSTNLLYKYKWSNFLKFAESKQLQPSPVSLSTLLQYLRFLFDSGLALSTLKVYISAIVSFQPRDSKSACLFSHPTLKSFLKGLANKLNQIAFHTPGGRNVLAVGSYFCTISEQGGLVELISHGRQPI